MNCQEAILKKLLNDALAVDIDFHSLSDKDDDLFKNVLDFLQEIRTTS